MSMQTLFQVTSVYLEWVWTCVWHSGFCGCQAGALYHLVLVESKACFHIATILQQTKKQFWTSYLPRAQYKGSWEKYPDSRLPLKEVYIHTVTPASLGSSFQSARFWVLIEILLFATLTALDTLTSTGSLWEQRSGLGKKFSEITKS